MKKIIALVAVAAMFAAFSISTVGKKLPSVGYVLVGPKNDCLLYTSPSPRDKRQSRMPSSA